MISYPNGLPVGLRAGRSYQLQSPLQRTQMGSGRARQRRQFTSVPQFCDLNWLFNDVQGQAFEAWWRDTLVDGSLWFEMPLKTPMGFEKYECRFTGVYSGPEPVGPRLWQYSGQLELRERAAPPEGEGLFPEDILYSELLDITINREWPAA